MALEDIQKDRIKKLNNIKSLGVNPYPAAANRKHIIDSARKMMDKKVVIAGRLRSLRPHGKIAFADLEDQSGRMQLFFAQNELIGEKFEFLTNLDLGDFVQVSGVVFKTQSGEITVRVADYQLLAKSIRPLPSAWYGLEDVEERYRQRYVDLIINPEVRKVFDTRSKIVRLMRHFMEEEGFVEVETPTLQPLYGGATAKPFVSHHNALDMKLYLRISDELYLKRLVVGGYEKVFEICKDFRNEGMDRQHNPEFTMMEFYWAYATFEDLMKLTEQMTSQIVREIHGKYTFEFEEFKLDFRPPFKRVSFNQLVQDNCGINLEKITTEDELKKVIKEKEINLELDGVVGFGAIADELYKAVARPKIKHPTFVTDYPSSMLPLAKANDANPTKAGSFQLICMGYELVKAYNELNDPLEQERRWKDEMDLAKRGLEEHQILDEDYIRALEYGMPPTAGWGMGIDRFVSLLTNQHTIKDVIIFPTLKPERKVNINDKVKVSEHVKIEVNKMTRDQAYELMIEMLKNKNLQKHGLAVEAIMRSLCEYLKKLHPELSVADFDQEEWAIVGMLHDADYELVEKDPARHTLVTAEKLKSLGGVSERVIEGIKAHHDGIKTGRDNLMESSVYAADELAGLITAVALVRPDKQLASVTVEAVMKKFPQKSFAAGANRNQILACEKELNIPLEKFVEIALGAMQAVSKDLGL